MIYEPGDFLGLSTETSQCYDDDEKILYCHTMGRLHAGERLRERIIRHTSSVFVFLFSFDKRFADDDGDDVRTRGISRIPSFRPPR